MPSRAKSPSKVDFWANLWYNRDIEGGIIIEKRVIALSLAENGRYSIFSGVKKIPYTAQPLGDQPAVAFLFVKNATYCVDLPHIKPQDLQELADPDADQPRPLGVVAGGSKNRAWEISPGEAERFLRTNAVRTVRQITLSAAAATATAYMNTLHPELSGTKYGERLRHAHGEHFLALACGDEADVAAAEEKLRDLQDRSAMTVVAAPGGVRIRPAKGSDDDAAGMALPFVDLSTVFSVLRDRQPDAYELDPVTHGPILHWKVTRCEARELFARNARLSACDTAQQTASGGDS